MNFTPSALHLQVQPSFEVSQDVSFVATLIHARLTDFSPASYASPRAQRQFAATGGIHNTVPMGSIATVVEIQRWEVTMMLHACLTINPLSDQLLHGVILI